MGLKLGGTFPQKYLEPLAADPKNILDLRMVCPHTFLLFSLFLSRPMLFPSHFPLYFLFISSSTALHFFPSSPFLSFLFPLPFPPLPVFFRFHPTLISSFFLPSSSHLPLPFPSIFCFPALLLSFHPSSVFFLSCVFLSPFILLSFSLLPFFLSSFPEKRRSKCHTAGFAAPRRCLRCFSFVGLPLK